MLPRASQGEREEPPELPVHASSLPPKYVQTLRASPRSWQTNVQDQVNDKWPNPQGSVRWVRSQSNLHQQTLSPEGPLSDAGFGRPQESSPTQRNDPQLQPRTLEFTMKIPVSSMLSIIKETSLANSPGSSVHLNEGSTKDQTSRIIEFSSSVPMNPPQNPSSSNVGYLPNLQMPQSAGFVQNSYMEPTNPQSSSAPIGTEWTHLAGTEQQQTQQPSAEQVPSKPAHNEPVAFSPGQSSQQMVPTGQTGQISFPSPQSQVIPGPGVPETPPQSLPPPNDPQHNPYSGYVSPQINPAGSEDHTNMHLPLSPPQYEPIPSENYNANSYAPAWQPGNNPEYNCPQYPPPCDCSQKETTPHVSATPTVYPSQYEHPTSYNRDVASSASHEAVNAEQTGQYANPSWSPYQHSNDPQGTDQPYQPQSTDHQTQMRLPVRDATRQSGRPKYIRLYIDVDKEADGENKYFTEETTQHDDYSGRNIARRANTKPNKPLSLQSVVSVRQDHLTDLLDSTYPSKRILRHYIQGNPLHV